MTEHLFTEDAYAKDCEATVVALDQGGIFLDKTVFYATSGGQPGDSGRLVRQDGTVIPIANAEYDGPTKDKILHMPDGTVPALQVGEKVTVEIDWERRYKLMKMHTACHILSVVCPLPITGAAVSEDNSRVDFDMSETADKAELTAGMMDIIDANHPVYTKWITEEELDANPGLVRSKNVKPPRGTGRIRLVCIGDDAAIDSQPCGGTHVKNTGELGAMRIGKIEKKGRENRRMRIRFGPLPE